MTDFAQIRQPILPITDLNLNSQLARLLNIPSDVQLVIATVMGLSEIGPKIVSITPAGAMRVAETGAGFTHVEVHEGSVMNNTVTINFTNVVSSVLINIDAFQCTVNHSEDGQTYDGPFTVLAGEKPSMDLLTRSLQIVNTSGTTATGYRLWGLYFGTESE